MPRALKTPQKSFTDEVLKKGLPANPDAERFILGSILLDGSRFASVVGAITEDKFALTKHKRIWTRMAELAERGETIDRVTLANELLRHGELESVDGLSYLVSLDEGLPYVQDISSYVRIVVEKWRLRQSIYTAQQILNQALSGEMTADEVSLNGQSMLAENVGGFGASQIESVREFVSSFAGGINTFLDPTREDPGILTGLRGLDEITGGFHAGEIFLIGARPRSGKSAMASCIAKNVARSGRRVAVFTLELKKKFFLRRMICEESYVSFSRFRTGDVDDEDRRRIREGTSAILDLPLYVDDTTGLRIADMRIRLNKLLRDGPVDLIVVDYAQLLKPPKGIRFNTENDKYTLIGEEIKALCNDTGVSMLLFSQLNRESEKLRGDNRPRLDQCRGAGIWEEIAFFGACLWREWLHKPDREDLREVAQLLTGKNRSGPEQDITLRFVPWLMRFGNRDPV